jgi:alginate O-acetyltransferase complex protein AlgI
MTSMLFFTYWFVYFIAALYPVYWLCRWRPARLVILLVACFVFHTHFAGPAGVLPIVVLSVLVYAIGLTRNRWLCALGIVASAVALVFYKYTGFLSTQLLAQIWPNLGHPWTREALWVKSIIPPLAISFFTFEFIHYLIEISRGGKPMKNPLDFALFTFFWPSIVAGPVKRYNEFLPALYQGVTRVGAQDVAEGLLQVAIGLVKKFTADQLTAWLAASYQPFHSGQFDPVWNWCFVIALSLRILLDFSGYSDMAIGFARMHGIALPANFNWPYLAENLADFWRRWHISLSSWIRDYIYIVLGGNRGGTFRKVLNGLTAFAICGLWHGAGWNFLFWGLYHGIGLAVCSTYRRVLGAAGIRVAGLLERHRVLPWGMTMVYVGVGWLFFFYPVKDALRMIRLLFCLT